MSLRTFRSTRRLEQRQALGDRSVSDAVALTPQGSLFGPPNGVVAASYFAIIGLLCAFGLMERVPYRRVALMGAWTSLSVSAYLVYQLRFVLRRECPMCMRAHILNLALTLVLSLRPDLE